MTRWLGKMKVLVSVMKEVCKGERWIWGIAGFVILIVLLETHFMLSEEKHSLSEPRYLKTLRTVDAGEYIGLRDLTFAYANSGKLPDDLMTDQDLYVLKGVKTRAALGIGSFVRKSDLLIPSKHFSENIPKGSRAYSISVGSHVPLGRGDRVDVLVRLNGRGPGENNASVILVSDTLVLEARRDQESIVVAVTQRDIQLLENATEHGKLVVALRNPEEPSGGGHGVLPRISRRPAKKIEVLTEGM